MSVKIESDSIIRILDDEHDDIIFNDSDLTAIPIGLPRELNGSFWGFNNQITAFNGSPSIIRGSYWMFNNKFQSIEGIPSIVGGSCNISDNQITSLHDIHKIAVSFRSFLCNNNPITSCVLGLMLLEIPADISLNLGKQIASRQVQNTNRFFDYEVDYVLNKWKNQGRRGVMGAMKELSDLGYEELAQL